MKKVFIALASIIITLNMNAQVKDKVEKAMNDPQRRANEAKADARLIDKTKIYNVDSANLKNANRQASKKDCTRMRKSGKKKAS